MPRTIEIVAREHGIELCSPKAWGLARELEGRGLGRAGEGENWGERLFCFVVLRLVSMALCRLGKSCCLAAQPGQPGQNEL